jgi:hypothetical protein
MRIAAKQLPEGGVAYAIAAEQLPEGGVAYAIAAEQLPERHNSKPFVLFPLSSFLFPLSSSLSLNRPRRQPLNQIPLQKQDDHHNG